MDKPAVFIGSSTEGLDFAKAVRSLLAADAETTLWNEGFFEIGATFIEALVNNVERFDFAILVMTPDEQQQQKSIIQELTGRRGRSGSNCACPPVLAC